MTNAIDSMIIYSFIIFYFHLRIDEFAPFFEKGKNKGDRK